MAVIKCSNCENEILDNEVVCPYCDCPLSETIKKMKKDDLKSFSEKSVDELTGKIPVIKEEPEVLEEPKLATSSDFEKEKAAILKDLGIKLEENKETETAVATEDKENDLEKTVKISRAEILGGKVKTSIDTAEKTSADKKSGTSSATVNRRSTRSSSSQRNNRKKNNYRKYIILAVTVLGIILVISLISKITNSISDSISSRRKTNRTVEVQSSAEAVEKLQGFRVNASTLEITDAKAMVNPDTGKSYERAEDYPWYDYKNSKGEKVEINHVTVCDGVESIGPYAFAGYTELKTIKLPVSISHIDDNAFYGCESLTEVIFHDASNLTEIGDSAFENCTELETIAGYTKEGSFSLELVNIGDRAFANCKSIKEFKLPDDIVLGEDVFDGHNDEFAIVCNEDSKAYDYAIENDIPVKEDFEERIVEKELKEEEPEEGGNGEGENEPSQNPQPQEPEETTPTTGNNGDEGNNNPPEENKPTLEELQGQLSRATTDEERQRILEEIQKYY